MIMQTWLTGLSSKRTKLIGIKINKKITISKSIKQNDHKYKKERERDNLQDKFFLIYLHVYFSLPSIDSCPMSSWIQKHVNVMKVLIGPLNASSIFMSRPNHHNWYTMLFTTQNLLGSLGFAIRTETLIAVSFGKYLILTHHQQWTYQHFLLRRSSCNSLDLADIMKYACQVHWNVYTIMVWGLAASSSRKEITMMLRSDCS